MIDDVTRRTLDGVNGFLEQVFGEAVRLSDLLGEALDGRELRRLKYDLLSPFLKRLVARWHTTLTEFYGERRADIVVERFSFAGEPAPTLAELGERHGLTRERVRQLQKQGLARLRGEKRRATLTQLAIDVAREILREAPRK